MNQKEIKAGMTTGEWKHEDAHNDHLVHTDDVDVCKMEDFYDDSPEYLLNTYAICYAVNNTYGAGIDPTRVPEMFALLKDIYNNIKPGAIERLSNEHLMSIDNLIQSATL